MRLPQYTTFLMCLLLFALPTLNEKTSTLISPAERPIESDYGNHALNITVTYRGLDVKERRVILGVSASGIGIGQENWQHIEETMGYVDFSWGTTLSDFKIYCSRVNNNDFSAVFNFEASLGSESEMLLYPLSVLYIKH